MKYLFRIVLLGIFLYMLASPWLTSEPEAEGKPAVEVVTETPEIEVPLHDVDLPDFAAIHDISERKHIFFSMLKPYVVAENKAILAKRELLDHALTELELGFQLPAHQIAQLADIFKDYKVAGTINEENLLIALNRVDSLPVGMVLTQAANESGWGTSRFARIGLNFFGLWCFKEGCGLVPNKRNHGSHHEVAAFTSLEAGVAAYFKNINTHAAYQALRDLRQSNRDEPSHILAAQLLNGLGSYSERGQDYIDELNQMLITNQRYFGE